MSVAGKLSTTVSTEGQVVLPRVILRRRGWSTGTRLTVTETAEGVLLKPVPTFAKTRPDDVFGVLSCKRKSKSVAEMDAGVLAEARRRHARD